MGAPKGKGGKSNADKGKGKGGKSKADKGKGKSAAPKGDSNKWVAVKPTCLVTGASGFVALNLIKVLVGKNYKVKGTVRSLTDESKIKPLKDLFPGITLVEADLLGGAESFEKAMEGVTYVFHTASPFQLSCEDPQKDFVDPALKGTEAVVGAAIKAGVSHIVVTSSCAAVGPPQPWLMDGKLADKEKVFTEEDWNTTSDLKAGPYRYSKRLAEEKAWELVKGNDNVKLTVMCPSFILGPPLTARADATSVKFIRDMLDGTMAKNGCNGGTGLGVIDVRDLCVAHVKAIEVPEAAGKRFILSSESGVSQLMMADMIRDRFKAYPVPTEGKEIFYLPKYSSAQAKEVLKVGLRDPTASMRDMANAAIRLGIVETKVLLKKVKFTDVAKINPDSKGLNLLVKVIKVNAPEETKSGLKVAEVVAGDATGVVALRLAGDEVSVAEVGSVVEVHNGAVNMKLGKGHVAVQIGKWGKFNKHEGDTEITPKESNDISATEYELVEN